MLYALNGAGQGVVDKSGWFDATDIVDFMADKNVNVVSPRGGTYTYYTDWVNDDPAIGRAKWQTFLTEELPPVIDAALGTDGVQSIMGISMSASSALDLAVQSGDLYSGVAAFSGCGRTTDDARPRLHGSRRRLARQGGPHQHVGPGRRSSAGPPTTYF